MIAPGKIIQEVRETIERELNGGSYDFTQKLDALSACFLEKENEAQKLNEAQANAIVHSAEIISELEETKVNLEHTKRIAEASAEKAKTLRSFGDILEHSLNEIYIFDMEHLFFAHANQSALKNMGYTLDEIQRLTPIDIKPEVSWAQFQTLTQPLRTEAKQSISFKTVHARNNGTTYPVEVQLETGMFQSRPVFAAIIRDITVQVESQEKTQRLQQELIDASRRAGISEITTGVLHNVGNILNSVNISVNEIDRNIRRSTLPKLKRATLLISENEECFADYVRDDPKGKILPKYLVHATSALGREHEQLLAELKDLQINVGHIKQAIASQQCHATSIVLVQDLTPREIIDEVVALSRSFLESSPAQIEFELETNIGGFRSDKNRILQVLANLVKNANDMFLEQSFVDPLIILRAWSTDDVLSFSVEDNGAGISEANLKTIFQYGYTTKKTGHGFGLHSSANAATEIGGQLTVFSRGPGQGATFELSLPL